MSRQQDRAILRGIAKHMVARSAGDLPRKRRRTLERALAKKLASAVEKEPWEPEGRYRNRT